MSNWTRDEELEMIKLIRNGLSFDEISKKNNRDIQSIESRLKKIIYENIKSGKTIDIVSITLNLDKNIVLEYYKSYKNIKNDKITNYDDKINKLEQENKLMKLLLENRELRKKFLDTKTI